MHYMDKVFGGNKKGTSAKKIDLPQVVGPKIQLGQLFISDLKRMAHIGSLERLDAEFAKYRDK